jgi:hypothetical protein
MTRTLSLATTLAAMLSWASVGLAQDDAKTKDDAIEGLLKKLEQTTPDDGSPKADKTDKKDGKAEFKKADEAEPKKDEKAKQDKDKLSTEDQALDNLLEKLGETKETPSPNGPPALRPKTGDENAPKTNQPQPGQVAEKNKDLDEHLEELTGRKPKKKQGGPEDQDNGPLADLVKQMREVEERLGKPDTGEETRKKQEQIVQRLDQLIEMLRNSQNQGKGRLVAIQQGKQQGGNSQNPGAQANANGVGASKPLRPNNKPSVANSKDVWGHLDLQLRIMMENVFREEPLPIKSEMIKRYYLSVGKKSESSGE